MKPIFSLLVALALPGSLLAVALSGGCTTVGTTRGLLAAAAVAQSSERAKLNSEPPRHFQLLLDVTLNDRTHRIEHTWTCTHEKVFSAGTMAWHMRWNSAQKLIAKKLEDGPLVFFREPVPGYCTVTGERNTVLDIGVTNSSDTPDEVVVYSGGGHRKTPSNVVKWTIRRLEGEVPKNPDPSREERRLVDFLLGPGKDLVSRNVRVTPVTVQDNATTATNAPSAEGGVIVATGKVSFFIKEPGIARKDDYRVYQVKARGDTVVWDPDARPDDAGIHRSEYRPEAGANDRPIDFCYASRCYRLEGAISEIYDPVRGVILTVSSLSSLRVFGMSG